MNSRLTKAVALGLTVASSLGATATAHAAPGMEVGLQDDAVFLYQSYYNRDTGLQQARQLGVTRLRVNILWSRVASAQASQTTPPAPVIYDWTPYDSLVGAAAAAGIKVQFSIAGPAPAWANGKHLNDMHAGAYKPNAALYGAFVRDVANHFKGRVDRYSIWNEPNWKGWLAPLKSSPQIYGSLYRAGYAAVKSVDPSAKVLFGELAPQERKGNSVAPLTFIKKATARGHMVADGFAHHPYAFTISPTSKKGGPNDVTMGTLGRLTEAAARTRTLAQAAGSHRRPAAAVPHRVRLLRPRPAGRSARLAAPPTCARGSRWPRRTPPFVRWCSTPWWRRPATSPGTPA